MSEELLAKRNGIQGRRRRRRRKYQALSLFLMTKKAVKTFEYRKALGFPGDFGTVLMPNLCRQRMDAVLFLLNRACMRACIVALSQVASL